MDHELRVDSAEATCYLDGIDVSAKKNDIKSLDDGTFSSRSASIGKQPAGITKDVVQSLKS